MALTNAARQKLLDAAAASSYLSMSSIPEAAAAAARREKEEAAARLQAQKLAASEAETEAALGMRAREGRLNRTAAQQRANTMATNLTAAQRAQLGDVGAAEVLAGDVIDDVNAVGDELGGLVGAGQWVFETIGLDPLTNKYKDMFVSQPVQALQAKAAALYTQAVQAQQKGVLSDQDFKRVAALNITDPSLDQSQLVTRLTAVQSILANTRQALAPGSENPVTINEAVNSEPATLSPQAQSYLE